MSKPDIATLKNYIEDLMRIRLGHIAQSNKHREKANRHRGIANMHDDAIRDLWDVITVLQDEIELRQRISEGG